MLSKLAAALRARIPAGVALCALLVAPVSVFAQAAGQQAPQGNWFVPKAQPAQSQGPARAARGPRADAAAAQEQAQEQAQAQADAQAQPADASDQEPPLPQYNLPPLAPLPPLTKTAPPPTAIIGVLGIPDVMRASTASQDVQKVIGARRDRLAADYQREQQVWRDMQQQLLNARGKISAAELTAREQALQLKVTRETKEFRARNRIIQEAGQISLAQIERVLVAVIRQVAESRGMNLVLHREQVALNVAEFDITDEVTAQLNTLLPSVVIPPDGQEPTSENTGGALPGPQAQAQAQAPQPAAAPR